MFAFEKDTSIHTGRFLLPDIQFSNSLWPVVACDQYTSQPEYWQQRDAEIGPAPSTLRLILPECWLGNARDRIPAIHQAMSSYVKQHIFSRPIEGLILIRRTIAAGDRWGLLVTVDLERYDFAPDSTSLIRPTEGTITDRIPPRLAVRAEAPLELSHVLLLADDPQFTLIEPLSEKTDQLPILYDMELNGSGGHLTGWAITDRDLLSGFFDSVRRLEAQSGGLSFAVGDGNHSLASAKALVSACGVSPAARLSALSNWSRSRLVGLRSSSPNTSCRKSSARTGRSTAQLSTRTIDWIDMGLSQS